MSRNPDRTSGRLSLDWRRNAVTAIVVAFAFAAKAILPLVSTVRLVISGSTCPNPGPDKTSVSTKPDKRSRRCQSDPSHNIKIAHLNIRSLKNHDHYILAKEAVRNTNY